MSLKLNNHSMGHVSDFNGMNTCDEAELSQATSDLISADNILDLPLNENFMPIYHSFPDDIYRQPHLYASSNLSSFMNNDDDRNGYFDEPLELDLFFDSNFNIDVDPILQSESLAVQNDAPNDFNIAENLDERNGNIQFKQESEPVNTNVQHSTIQTLSFNDLDCQENHVNGDCQENHVNVDCQENHVNVDFEENHVNIDSQKSHLNVDNLDPLQPGDSKTYTAEAVFNGFESTDEKNVQIPKVIIRLKTEPLTKSLSPPNGDKVFPSAEVSAPLTIADNVKLGRRRNGNLLCDETGQIKTKDVSKRKTHKRKSRHKKKHHTNDIKNKIPDINQNFNGKLPNSSAVSFTGEKIFLNQNKSVNINVNDSKTSQCFLEIKNGVNCHLSNENIIEKSSSSSVGKDFYLCENDCELHNLKTESLNDDIVKNVLSEQSVVADAVDFEFELENANALSLSPSIDMGKDADNSVEDFLEHIDITLDHNNIPDLNKSLLEEAESVKIEFSTGNSLSNGVLEKEFYNELKNESTVADREPIKSNSASDLIEELNAHHQQVFEEIEVSTPELELELHEAKNSTYECPETSRQSQSSANDHAIIQNKIIVAEHGENDMNSQNHLSANKIPSSPETVSTFHSATNNHSDTAQPRNISSSGSSITNKSSTSHRSYRKRRRSSSFSSNSSDKEKFYNRPVKFDPITQTYCDEFGREIRPTELKYYLNAKSGRRDSHSNNGSSSSSRSKSPRYRSYHRKHHKSRSGSRSHRRRRHSSSHSRSRSRGQRYKGDSDRKYRSPSPQHRSKRHYLDVEENMRAYEERRVMYVGDIPPDYTVEQLKDRFGRFGPIQAASIKSKYTADGSLYIFGFVTFKNRSDVCQAIERGNENPSWPRFDLNFGGRRRFCNGNYTDLDGKVAEAESGWYGHQTPYRQQPQRQEDDFAELLRQEQRRLGMGKK